MLTAEGNVGTFVDVEPKGRPEAPVRRRVLGGLTGRTESCDGRDCGGNQAPPHRIGALPADMNRGIQGDVRRVQVPVDGRERRSVDWRDNHYWR